jgi:3-hydroxyacyl-[acyl-carrier-protein] dehydratase
MTPEKILSLLPYSKPFLFVDSINKIDANSVVGTYKYNKDDFFYKGHFKNYPVTPGVILTETMAQIGLVCLGIYLLKDDGPLDNLRGIAMTSAQIDYLLPVYPGETVSVISEKDYFRFGKLKCRVQMRNADEKVVCMGTISGIIKRLTNE